MTGMKVYLYPTPLHYRQIPELVYNSQRRPRCSAPTRSWRATRATPTPTTSDTVRYLVCGAEPVKAETRRIYMEKFGLRILEGYGVTEASPVLAVNTPMFNRNGSVGRLLPAVEHRLEAVPGIDDGGRLYVRGPNVMARLLSRRQSRRDRGAAARLARHRRHRRDRSRRFRLRSRDGPSASPISRAK